MLTATFAPVGAAPAPPHHHPGLRGVPFGPQDFLHPVQGSLGPPHHHHQGALGHFPLQMMSHLQQQYSGLVAPAVAPMGPKGADRTQLGGARLAEDGSPTSPQGGLSPGGGSVDDRKLPRPIGTERAQKKGAHASYPGIWSYSNSGGSGGLAPPPELSAMQAWVQYQHATGPHGDGLAPLLQQQQHSRFAPPEAELEGPHSYHHVSPRLISCGPRVSWQLLRPPAQKQAPPLPKPPQPQGALGAAGPPFLNGFPGGAAAGAMLGGAAPLFPSPARVSAEAPHQPQEATPWSPHKLMGGAPGDSLHHHHQAHHPQQQPPPHHGHVATAKLPWQSWTHHQT